MLASTHRFVSALDEELKRPHGMLYEGPESDPSVAMGAALNDHHRGGSLIVVGDVSVATCLALDVVPDVAIVDGMTKREPLSADLRPRIEGYPVKLHCENPPGLLTSDLKGTIVTAITSDRPVVIIVEGEEDLAPHHRPSGGTPRNNGPLWATWGRCGAPADHVGGQGALSAIARILRGDRLTLVTLTVCARMRRIGSRVFGCAPRPIPSTDRDHRGERWFQGSNI